MLSLGCSQLKPDHSGISTTWFFLPTGECFKGAPFSLQLSISWAGTAWEVHWHWGSSFPILLSPYSPFLSCVSHLHRSLNALLAHSCLLSLLFFTDVFLNKSFAHTILFWHLFPGRPKLIQRQSSNLYLIYRIFFLFLILYPQRRSIEFIKEDLPKMYRNRSGIQLHAPLMIWRAKINKSVSNANSWL